MPAHARIIVVCMGFARVKNRGVVEQLDVTTLEYHLDLECWVVGDLFY